MNDSDNSKVTKFEGKLVVIAGPTASGKTSVAINLAEKLNTVVVSADSRQFYKEIPIGTAAPDLSERRGIDHFFIGNLSIHDYYNVYIYSNEVIDLLDSRFWDKEYIVMAGGSGLYIDAVCKGIDELPDIDSKIREKIKDIYSNKGIDELIRILSDIDPEYLVDVDIKNPARLMRAIEVNWQTGRKYSDLRSKTDVNRNFRIIKIGLEVERGELIDRINKRTEDMMLKGWVKEAKDLYNFRHLNSLNTVGYKELFRYFDGEISFEEAKEKIKVNTRRYAKRQMTWFRKDNHINWIKPHCLDEMISFIRSS